MSQAAEGARRWAPGQQGAGLGRARDPSLPFWGPMGRCCWESSELPGQSLGLDSGADREDQTEGPGSGEEGHGQGRAGRVRGA